MAFSNSRLRNLSKSLGLSHRGRLFEFKKNNIKTYAKILFVCPQIH